MKKLLSLMVVAVMIGCAGAVSAEETVIAPNPDPIVLDTDIQILPVVKGTVTLTEGWNLIAIPVLPAEQLKIKDFIYKVEGGIPPCKTNDVSNEVIYCKPMWNVSAVAVYKDGRFRMYTREDATYNMVPGEAYFVHCRYLGPRPVYSVLGPDYPMPVYHPKTTITIAGKCVNATVSLDLNKGWNGVGVALMQQRPPLVIEEEPINLPAIPRLTAESDDSAALTTNVDLERICAGFSLVQFSRELSEQGVKASRVIFWNAEKQEWEQYSLPYPVADENGLICMPIPGRLIDPGEGFFLLCEENGLYIPRLEIQKKPYPPIPVPRTVTYSGTIEKSGSIVGGVLPYNYVIVCSTETSGDVTTV
ncbi:MAG: hypothetical protein PHN63_00695, partial [Candidatus Omnitrophica bacterium]|nr:hypothetical protein [Candidatus Omnitrophota bacterium]